MTREQADGADQEEILPCYLIVDEEDGTFTLLDRTKPFVIIGEWHVGTDTYPPLISKEDIHLQGGEKIRMTAFMLDKGQVDWEMTLRQVDGSDGDELDLYMGLAAIVKDERDDYYQVNADFDAPRETLIEMFKGLPNDIPVWLVDANIYDYALKANKG